MIKLLLLAIFSIALNASNILSYNIYDRTDRADVMITFDTPYDGVIKQSRSKSKIIIKLMDTKIEASKLKHLSSKFLYSLSITPMAGFTQIVASVPSGIKLKASRTSDAYGLRLRFSENSAMKTKNKDSANSSFLSDLPTKNEEGMTKSYIIVSSILIIGILILLFLKKKLTLKQGKPKENSWLFKDNQQTSPQTQTQTQSNSNDISIRFQKNIDSSNSVVMLDFGDQSFLVLMGLSNILLEKFTDNKPQTQEDFETILQNRNKELDNFISAKDSVQEHVQAYKEKAASISYAV